VCVALVDGYEGGDDLEVEKVCFALSFYSFFLLIFFAVIFSLFRDFHFARRVLTKETLLNFVFTVRFCNIIVHSDQFVIFASKSLYIFSYI
jgi:hypothetical protein